ncbi:putative glucokinase 2 [Tritrichomonas foetus]|uniref:Glucokinase 2 n=1 Tax=Tritrichomonas foetus TaxID=1144522 RepID=A0A1J4JHI7_9EUKA|nr:putative glucokinase 2 [Tritrichomonas foetus]|eukprot:OHS96949.1 putative glucokinase 2 [Tritrichomonas foetus]
MIDSSLLAPLSNWEQHKICVGVDIGGSGLRIRISNVLNENEHVDLPHIRAKSTQDVIDIFENLEKALAGAMGDFESKGAALAVAGPIKNNEAVITNWPGEPSVRTLKIHEFPSKVFPHDRTVLLNDLEAGAYGVVAADEQKIVGKYFEQMFKDKSPPGPVVADTRTAVMALGSGLGVAFIHKRKGAETTVLPAELGHLQVNAICSQHPDYEIEQKLIQHVSNHYYKGRQCPEYEDFCSGRGIQLNYQFFYLQETGKLLDFDEIDAGEVAKKAKEGEKAAKEAMTWCYKLLLREARNLAITFVCDSIVFALDNQVRNKWFVDEIETLLKDEFYDYLRPDWIAETRIYTQTEILNFNVLGVELMSRRMATNK